MAEWLTRDLDRMEERLVEDEEQLARVRLYIQRNRNLHEKLVAREEALKKRQGELASAIEERETTVRSVWQLKDSPPVPYDLSISDPHARASVFAATVQGQKHHKHYHQLRDAEKLLKALLHIVAEHGGKRESGGKIEGELLGLLLERGWTPDHISLAMFQPSGAHAESLQALVAAARSLGLLAVAEEGGGGASARWLCLTKKGISGYDPGLWDVRVHLRADSHCEAAAVVFQLHVQQVAPFLALRPQSCHRYERNPITKKANRPLPPNHNGDPWTPGANQYYTLVARHLRPGTYIVHARQYQHISQEMPRLQSDLKGWGPSARDQLCFTLYDDGSLAPAPVPPNCRARPYGAHWDTRERTWADLADATPVDEANLGREKKRKSSWAGKVMKCFGDVRDAPGASPARVEVLPWCPEEPAGVPPLCVAVLPLLYLPFATAAKLWLHVQNIVRSLPEGDALLDLASAPDLPHASRIAALLAGGTSPNMVHCLARALGRRIEVYELRDVNASSDAQPAVPVLAVGNKAFWPAILVATGGSKVWLALSPQSLLESPPPVWEDSKHLWRSPWHRCKLCLENGAHTLEECPQAQAEAPVEGGQPAASLTSAMLAESHVIRDWYRECAAACPLRPTPIAGNVPKTKTSKAKAEGTGADNAQGKKQSSASVAGAGASGVGRGPGHASGAGPGAGSQGVG